MIERPDFVEKLLDRILYEWNLPIIDQQLALGVDGFYFAEDWGSETAPLFSPRMWRRFIKPRLAVMYERAGWPRCGRPALRRRGGVYFPDLIEIGLQVFNPLSPTIMDLAEYKAKYGDRLTFYGGIDVERLIPFGTPDEVRREVRHMAELMGRGGGYILQTSPPSWRMRRWRISSRSSRKCGRWRGFIDVQIMFRGRGDPLRSPRAGARHCPYYSSDRPGVPEGLELSLTVSLQWNRMPPVVPPHNG